MTTTHTSGAADLPEALHRVIDDFERRERPHPWEGAQPWVIAAIKAARAA